MKKWWEDYPEISSNKFTYENSGRANQAVAPYDVDYINYDGKFIKKYSDWNGEPIGYTLTPPMFGKSLHDNWVGIMFEIEVDDGHVDMWWHWPIGDDSDYE